MKTFVHRGQMPALHLTPIGYVRPEDEIPAGALEVPPKMLNRYQRAELELQMARQEILDHLARTEQQL